MAEDQRNARIFGVLYLLTFITSIPALLLYEPALRHPEAFAAGSGNVNKIYLGALLELLLLLANIGTAVVIVPIMRRQFEVLSIGYVTARIVESTFILVGILAMLGLATLQQDTAGAAEATVAYTLAAIKDWTFILGPGWMVGWGNGLILGYMMYRTQLVPRPWPWLGLIGGPLIIISGTAVMFGGGHPSGTLQGLATIPEALWELFLGVYCTIWGFRRDAPILSEDARHATQARSERNMNAQPGQTLRASEPSGAPHRCRGSGSWPCPASRSPCSSSSAGSQAVATRPTTAHRIRRGRTGRTTISGRAASARSRCCSRASCSCTSRG